MSSSVDEEATISIPSLAFVAVLGYFIYRYFFSSSRSNADRSHTSSSRNNGLRFTPAQVDQIAQMFPQLSRRDIMWDLHRNGGSVQATTERVLTGQGLDAVCRLYSRTTLFGRLLTFGIAGSPIFPAADIIHAHIA